eukprot:403350921
MSLGSKFIIESKQRDTNAKEEEIRKKCQDNYASKNQNQNISMIDIYIENSHKQQYFTPGIQRFEEGLVTQLKKIQEYKQAQNNHEDTNQSDKLNSKIGIKANTSKSQMNRRQQVRNIKTAGDLTTSRARGNINKQDESMLDQAESSFITKPRQYSNLRGSYQHIYYNEGIPKTLLNKKLEKSNKNFQISLSNKNKSQASAYLQNNVDISKDKLDFARGKWLQKHGIQILMMDSKESEDESRKLFRYIDYNNDGVISRAQIKMFIKFLEDEFKSDKSILESNQIMKQLKKIANNNQVIQLNEDQFSQEITKLQHKKQHLNFYSTSSNSHKKEAVSSLVKQKRDNIADLIALDADTLERKLLQNTRNLQKDSQYAIDQAKINFERAGHLKQKLEQVMTEDSLIQIPRRNHLMFSQELCRITHSNNQENKSLKTQTLYSGNFLTN